MSSGFHLGAESMIVSNQRFDSLIEFAIETAAEMARTPAERTFGERFRQTNRDVMYPGYDLLIDEEFPTHSERVFWCKVFGELSRKILSRDIANPDAPEAVRLSLAADAGRVAEMLRL